MGKLNTAVEAGISVSKEGKNFDFYRNRIIIPIHDKDGQLCGIAGRIMPTEVGSAKYFNPVESPIYHKSQVWFGLYQALTARAFKTHDFAYIVEGYFDVIALHEAGCTNTVAACGTAIPDEQFKILLRYTKHFVFMLDGDKAGLEKAMKHIDTALRLGAKVDVVELPDNMDPADYVHKMNALPVEEMEEVEMEEV